MIGYPWLENSSYLFQSTTVHIYIPNQEILSWEMFQAAVIVLCSQNCSNCYRVKLTQWIMPQLPLQCSLVSQPLYWHYIDQSFLKATEDWNCEPSLKLSVGLRQTVNIYSDNILKQQAGNLSIKRKNIVRHMTSSQHLTG